MIISCIAVDDEPLAIEKVKSFAERMPQLQMLATFTNSISAFDFVRNNSVQLIFLDIQMDKMTGIEMLEKMIVRPQVILTTAYSEYAMKGFDLAVTDFLLKPYTFDRFSLAVGKATEIILWQQASLAVNPKPVNYIFVKSGYKLVKIFIGDIQYVEAMRDYQNIVTHSEQIIASHSINELEKLLPEGLVRCHKSFIVSLSAISSIEHDRIRIGNKYIPIGDSYKDAFYKQIQKT
jgi:two-component system, LytTR family, response regulator